MTGTILFASAAEDTAANDIAYCHGEVVAHAAPGAAVAIHGAGQYDIPKAPGTASPLSWVSTGASLATNGALLLEITGEWNAADANSVQLEHLFVEVI